MADRLISLYRARLARERGAIRKDWGGKTSVALVYPNSYSVAMSNLGFQLVYALFNKREDVVAERVFLPQNEEMSLHLETGRGLLSLESLSPLQKFDLIAFSLSFENDYPNILKILELGKIPLLAEDRDDFHPLVMAGGITTFLNPEPLAPFFDFFLLGEAEATLDAFVTLFGETRSSQKTRRGILRSLAGGLKSLYVPSFYRIHYDDRDGTIKSREPTESGINEKIVVPSYVLGEGAVNRSCILTPETEFSDKVLVELGRGCGRSCRFCAAGFVYRPPRSHREADLFSCVEGALHEGHPVGLLSANVSDTPGIEELTALIVERGGTFSVSSLRADSLSGALIEHLKRAGQRSLAIAPEAGSERMRKVVNKHLTREQIIEVVRMIAGIGDFGLRLYFLIGLPTETLEDVEEILELVKSIKHHIIKESRTRGKIRQIRLSVNCFIPKPSTPFQWFPMEDVSSLKEKQKWLRKSLNREGGVKVSFDVPKWAYLQTLLSVGDRRVGSILLLSHQLNQDWTKVFRYSEVNPDFFVHRPKALEERLPWDFIDLGIRKEHLVKEYKLALKGIESDVCHVGECDRCGVCTNRH